jgi:hypothetical protein
MCDVRKSVIRMVLMGVAAGLLAGALVPAKGQVGTQVQIRKRKQEHARRETNASRKARIQRTIDETYAHKYEVIGGGGYLRFRAGDYLKKNNEVTWATQFNYYLNSKLAVVGDARGAFGSANAYIDNQYGVYKPQINEYLFMGGASYRFYQKEKVAISGQAVGGVGWGIFSGGSKAVPATYLGLWSSETRPAFSLGVSVDYNIQQNLAVRFTPTYVGTMFRSGPAAPDPVTGLPATTPPSPSVQNNVGFNIGVVYRFGRR